MLPPSDEPLDEQEQSSGLTEEYPLDAMLTDLAYFYHRSIAEIVATPRRFRRMMIENVQRLTAQKQILDTAVTMFPHISAESREEQMSLWRRLAKLLGFVGSAIEQVLWEGTVPDNLPKGMVVAENWETVSSFFASGKGDLPGMLTEAG